MNMLEYAWELQALGWHLYPLHGLTEDGCTCEAYKRSEAYKRRLEKIGRGEEFDPNFVCPKPGKHPRTMRGLSDATNSKRTITNWWLEWPSTGIGVNCGASGIIAIDCDTYKDPMMQRAIEHYLGDTSKTVTSKTGGGGYHFLYQAPEGVQIRSSQVLLEYTEDDTTVYLELKAHGGTFNAPPSPHPSGNRYEWIRSPFDFDLQPLPQAIANKITEAVTKRAEALASREAFSGEFDNSGDYELAREALTYIPIEQEYQQWWEILAAVHSRWPDEYGVDLIERWSPGYPGEVSRIFRGMNPNGGIVLGTLFKRAKEFGFRFPERKRPRTASKGSQAPKSAEKAAKGVKTSKTKKKPAMRSEKELQDLGGEFDDLGIDIVSSDEDYPPYRLTTPYAVKDGRLCIVKVTDDDIKFSPIGDFACKIIEQVDHEDGRRFYTIQGKPVRGRPFKFDIDAVDFGKQNTVSAIVDARAGGMSSVAPGMAKHVGPAIKAMSQDINYTLRLQRTGWSDGLEKYYLAGRDLPGVEFNMMNQMSSYMTDPAQPLSKGIDTLDNLINILPPERTTVALTAMLTSVMSQIVGAARYGIFFRGRSGTYKTTFCQLAMCIFGDFTDESSIIKAGTGATENAMMEMIASAADAPIMLDNWKPNTTRKGGFASLIHAATEGREKNRLSQTSDQRLARTLRAWLLMTGEDIPDDDGGTIARMLVLPLAATRRTDHPHIDFVQENALTLNAVGREWIDWVEGEGRAVIIETWKSFQLCRARWAKIVRSQRDDVLNAGRIASNLATNDVAFSIICQHPTIGKTFKAYKEQHESGLRELAKYMAAETTESMAAIKLLNYINAMLIDGSATLIDTRTDAPDRERERMIGYRKDDQVLLLMTNVLRRVKEAFGPNCLNGEKSSSIYAQIDSLGLIANGYEAKPVPRTINGKGHRLLILDAERFDNYAKFGENEGDDEMDPSIVDAIKEMGL